MAGPTVGADGNIYAVTDGGGLGALSLTPGGQLIWNQTWLRELSGNWFDARPAYADPALFCGGCRAGLQRIQ
jgi:hypothetical protein